MFSDPPFSLIRLISIGFCLQGQDVSNVGDRVHWTQLVCDDWRDSWEMERLREGKILIVWKKIFFYDFHSQITQSTQSSLLSVLRKEYGRRNWTVLAYSGHIFRESLCLTSSRSPSWKISEGQISGDINSFFFPERKHPQITNSPGNNRCPASLLMDWRTDKICKYLCMVVSNESFLIST